MRAFAVRKFGETPGIYDLPVPSGEDAYLARVSFAGVNPGDNQRLQQLTAASAFPFVVGSDFAGTLEGLPKREPTLAVGERVFGIARTHGSYAEHTALTPGTGGDVMARIPDSVTDEQAAALPIPAVTALGSLELLDLSAGQRLLVMGANGAVGGYAVQMARARGVHVFGTVHGNGEEARRLGAEEVYDTKTGPVIDAVHQAHPDGLDRILDLVNDAEAIRRDAEILKSGGVLVSTRHAADEKWFAERHLTARNTGPANNPKNSPAGLAEIAALVVDGTIAPRVRSVVGLDQAGQMLEKIRTGGLDGKALIQL
jgi:NADPH:quinone reductase-like Zn-dependent oxidoreductase